MIWEQYSLTRAGLVIFSTIAAMHWLLVGFANSRGGMDWACLLFLLHSLGMIGLCAGFFGQRKWALLVALLVGLMWIVALGLLFQGIDINMMLFSDARYMFGSNYRGLPLIALLACSGFGLFFVTYLLWRTNRQAA